jgi:hypothetical protein
MIEKYVLRRISWENFATDPRNLSAACPVVMRYFHYMCVLAFYLHHVTSELLRVFKTVIKYLNNYLVKSDISNLIVLAWNTMGLMEYSDSTRLMSLFICVSMLLRVLTRNFWLFIIKF